MRDIKMIVTDLDGTLLRNNKTISDRTLRVLEQCRQRGIVFVIATARFWIGAEKVIDLVKPDYVISADGTMAHDAEKLICECRLHPGTTNLLIQKIREAKEDAEIITAVDRTVYWNSLHIAESARLYKAQYYDYHAPFAQGAHKIAAELPGKEDAERIAGECVCKMIGYRGENIYSFIAQEAGKAQMIQRLAEYLDISMEQVVAFGDDENDIEMLQVCGIGVAVANALPEVKAAADVVTLSNEQDGVAHFLEVMVSG